MIVEEILRTGSNVNVAGAALASIGGDLAENFSISSHTTATAWSIGGVNVLATQLQDGAFMHAFTAKGRFANLLSAAPVHVIKVDAALRGAAIYGLEQAARHGIDTR